MSRDRPMSVRTAKRISLVLRIAAGLMLAATLWLTILDRSLYGAGDLIFIVPVAIAMVTYLVVGSVLAAHQPQNWIGWAFLIVGTSLPAGFLASEYAVHALVVAPGSLPGATWAAWLGNWLFLVPISQITLTLLLFPDGRLPTRRWRIVAWGLAVGMSGAVISTMLRPADIEVQKGVTVPNLAAIGSDAFWGPVTAAAGILAVVSAILSAVSLFVRYRRSRGEERQQIRWLAYVGLVTVFCFFLAFAGNIGVKANESTTIGDLTWLLFILALALGIPVATAVAVLKYPGCNDLDLVVKKTAVFTIVALFLTGLYLLGLGLAALSGLGAIFAAACSSSRSTPSGIGRASLADRIVYGNRATPYEVLSRLREQVAGLRDRRRAAPDGAAAGGDRARARRACGCAWAELRRGVLAAPLSARSEPAGADELAPTAGARPSRSGTTESCWARSPRMPANDPMDPAKRGSSRDLAAQAGLVLRNVRLIEDLRASRQRLVAAQDEERRRIERNIHDGAQQQLVALAVQLKLARTPGRTATRRRPDRCSTAAGRRQRPRWRTCATWLAASTRRCWPTRVWRPRSRPRLGAPRPGRRCDADGVGRYPQDVEAAVYFCCARGAATTSRSTPARHRPRSTSCSRTVSSRFDRAGRRRRVRRRHGNLGHRAARDDRPPGCGRRQPLDRQRARARNHRGGPRAGGGADGAVSRHSLLVVSRAVTAVTAALLLVDIGLTVADSTFDGGDVQFVVTFAVGIIAMGVIGAVLSSRAPSNPIGWLFQGTAFCLALAGQHVPVRDPIRHRHARPPGRPGDGDGESGGRAGHRRVDPRDLPAVPGRAGARRPGGGRPCGC